MYFMETPPRAWGRPRTPELDYGDWGNTPTSVGKTVNDVVNRASTIETPPRAWGRPAVSWYSRSLCRNTPTSVGKTSEKYWIRVDSWKHPHERGEDSAR